MEVGGTLRLTQYSHLCSRLSIGNPLTYRQTRVSLSASQSYWQMGNVHHISWLSSPATRVPVASVRQVRRRGCVNLRLGIDVNTDPRPKRGRARCEVWMLALCGEWSGGTYSGLKPSLAH